MDHRRIHEFNSIASCDGSALLSTNNTNMANDTIQAIKTNGSLAMPRNPYKFLHVNRPFSLFSFLLQIRDSSMPTLV